MIRTSALYVQPLNMPIESHRPLLIGPKNASPKWIADLENWCHKAPEKELPNMLKAAKHMLQQYANPQTKILDLSNMGLTSLPPNLWHLVNLQELNVSQNPNLQALPDGLRHCSALRSINASSCSIKRWPGCLSQLPLLETVLLDDNPDLRVFPEELRRCRALKHLSMETTKPPHLLMTLSNVAPKDIPPEWLADLQNWCHKAPEKELPNRLKAATHVLQQCANPQNKTLDFSNMELTSLPPRLWYMDNLQELNVSQNPDLQALPNDLRRCSELRSINASSCSIKEWPECLSQLPLLQTLLLNDNPVILRVLPSQIRECRALVNLGMVATKLEYFEHAQSRLLPLGEARGRALVRSPSGPLRQSHGKVRTRSASPPAHASTPPITNMLGVKKAYELDKKFGSLQWPYFVPHPSSLVPATTSIKSWEFDDDGKPLILGDRIFVPDEKDHFPNLADLLDLEALKRGEKKYAWTISKSGRLIIAEEKKMDNDPLKTLGHPTLVGGGRARIAGELRWNPPNPKNPSSEGVFYIVGISGRYSFYRDRKQEQLLGAAELFRQAGLAIKISYSDVGQEKRRLISGLQEFALEDLILPNKK